MTTPSINNSISRPPLRRGLPRKQPRKLSGPRTQARWIIRGYLLTPLALALAWFALTQRARAVCQEGCLTNQNTVLGDDALFSNTTGFYNIAIGVDALYSNTTGSNNTAIGVETLFNNTTGNANTAIGRTALYSNTTGDSNTANGLGALLRNTTGSFNTANGVGALEFNTTGDSNTATGDEALHSNTTGFSNTANGVSALYSNTTGLGNTASGYAVLVSNTTGSFDTATGVDALQSNTIGNNNTANGYLALSSNTTGSSNIALGVSAGANLTTGDNNIDVGNAGVADEANTIRVGTVGTQTATFIAGIRGTPIAGGVAVGVSSSGQLGVRASSMRFKKAIKPMDKASEAILALKPVIFRYKHELDPEALPQFGLVAEDVERVNPDLVARDDEGKPYTVRYEAVNAMLLNEFLKEHRKGLEQDATISELKFASTRQQGEIAKLTATVKEQAAQIQKVSEQLVAEKAAPHLVVNE
jgi:trimeric autotransporter adhesin